MPESAKLQVRPAAEDGPVEKAIPRNEANDFSKVAIENLGQVEFDQAYELIHSAPKEALVGWARRLEAMPFTPRKTSAIAVFFKTLAQVETKAAVDVALAIERSGPRWTAINAICAAAPAADLPEVARMYAAIREDTIPVAGDLISRWSATDPEATARFLSDYSGQIKNDDIASLMWNWAALAPAAAARWLENAPPDRKDADVYAAFYAGRIFSDRSNALAELAAHSADKTFEKALKTVSENLFTESADAARAFIVMLPDQDAQKTAIKQISQHITGVWLGSSDYLHLNAGEVTKWLFGFPESLWHEEIGSVMDNWAKEDAPAVDAWLNQIPSQVRDNLLAEHSLAFNWNRPTEALRAGLRISNPTLRSETFRQLFKDMAKEGKQELIKRAELSAEEARELAQLLKHL